MVGLLTGAIAILQMVLIDSPIMDMTLMDNSIMMLAVLVVMEDSQGCPIKMLKLS